MLQNASMMSTGDEKLFSSLLTEIHCIEELVDVLEGESVSMDEVVGLVCGVQRDIVQLYRAAGR